MLLARSTEEAQQNQRVVHVHGYDYVLSEYIGAAPVRGMYVEGNEVNDNDLPQGFLVEQPPGSVTPAHFHEVNQFQVFVGGTGKMGKQEAQPVTVHYAGGHTPYGPITAGDEGVQYFTLRAAWDPGAKYMPKSRNLLKPVPRRHRLADPVQISDAAALATRSEPALDILMEREEDALAAYVLRLGSNARMPVPAPSDGSGQYHVVVNGGLVRDGTVMPKLSCLFVYPDESPCEAEAGPDGLEMLVLQFPKI
jgi:hypothetical protein